MEAKIKNAISQLMAEMAEHSMLVIATVRDNVADIDIHGIHTAAIGKHVLLGAPANLMVYTNDNAAVQCPIWVRQAEHKIVVTFASLDGDHVAGIGAFTINTTAHTVSVVEPEHPVSEQLPADPESIVVDLFEFCGSCGAKIANPTRECQICDHSICDTCHNGGRPCRCTRHH